MSMKPLTFYQQGAVAGMQQDQYSQAPWFIRSKNVDIFSSTQSIKATAWADYSPNEGDIVDVEATGRFELHKNWRVRDNAKNKYITSGSMHTWAIKSVEYIPWTSVNMTIGTPLALFVERGIDDWETIVVITTNLIYTKVNKERIPAIKIKNLVGGKLNSDGSISGNGSKKYIEFDIDFEDVPGFVNGSELVFEKQIKDWDLGNGDIMFDRISAYQPKLVYNESLDELVANWVSVVNCLWSKTSAENRAQWVDDSLEIVNTRIYPEWISRNGCLRVKINIVNTQNPQKFDGKIIINNNESISSYSNFIADIKNQKVKREWENYILNWKILSKVYNFTRSYKPDWSLKRIDFLLAQTLPVYLGLETVDVVASDTQIFRLGNKRGDGIISRFPLVAWEEGEHITYPGIEFMGATRINSILYCIAKNRGVGVLYAFNGSELIPIITWEQKAWQKDLIGNAEQFDFKFITQWKGNIILWTKDNKVFSYGKTKVGKGLSLILQLEEGEKLTNIKESDLGLVIFYLSGAEKKRKIYNDDLTIKKYHPEFEVLYPISVWNHMIEKEAQDIAVSYLLPSKECSLEVWASGNHYHFWTFKLEGAPSLSPWSSFTLLGCKGDYELIFVEEQNGRYTFELHWDLPYQVSNSKKIKGANGETFSYSDFNHFRFVGEITTNSFKEGVDRFTNINSALNLPITHSLQIMIRGKGTQNYSPELFGVFLSANQRER